MNLTFSKPDNKKQKIIAVLLVLVGIILIWQLYELFAGDKPAPKAVAPAAKSTMAKQALHQQTMAVTPTATATQLAQNAAATDNDAVNPADANQSEYLRLVNEYQMAQLQRMIAEDNEAIAIAKQNAAKAMSETSKLMGGGGGLTTVSNSNQTNTNDYQLVYTGQQSDNSWSATLKKNGQSFDVVVGGKLPDGSQVLSIDDNGVLLQQGNIKKLVTFSGVTETAAQPAANAVTPAQNKQLDHELADLPKLAAAANNMPAVAPAPVTKSVEKKEQAEKTEAALTATPDNPTAPEKKERVAVTKPQPILVEQKPAENKPATKKEKAEKTEAALKATPDNPTAPAKKEVIASSAAKDNTVKQSEKTQTKVEKKPAAAKTEQAKSQPVAAKVNKETAIAPAMVKTADLKIPDSSKLDSSLLPLQQPMVMFPHHAKVTQTEAAKPSKADAVKAVNTAVTATPATNLANSAVLAVNPNYYTIQLTGDHKLANLQQFISKHDLQNKASYFRTYDMQNRELYILIYGQYTTSAEAKAALKQLPESAKAEGAFVVKYATIQTVLKKPVPAANKQ